MKNRISRSLYLVILLTGVVWAADTDAEIMKDLDFYMNMDVVREDAVTDEAADFDAGEVLQNGESAS